MIRDHYEYDCKCNEVKLFLARDIVFNFMAQSLLRAQCPLYYCMTDGGGKHLFAKRKYLLQLNGTCSMLSVSMSCATVPIRNARFYEGANVTLPSGDATKWSRKTYYTPHRSLIPVLMQFLRFAQKLQETGKN